MISNVITVSEGHQSSLVNKSKSDMHLTLKYFNFFFLIQKVPSFFLTLSHPARECGFWQKRINILQGRTAIKMSLYLKGAILSKIHSTSVF